MFFKVEGHTEDNSRPENIQVPDAPQAPFINNSAPQECALIMLVYGLEVYLKKK